MEYPRTFLNLPEAQNCTVTSLLCETGFSVVMDRNALNRDRLTVNNSFSQGCLADKQRSNETQGKRLDPASGHVDDPTGNQPLVELRNFAPCAHRKMNLPLDFLWTIGYHMLPIKPDYETLIDKETWAFIRRTEHWYPPETTSFSIQQQRKIYDAMCREFHRGYPEGVIAEDDHTDIATRHYCVKQAAGVSAEIAQIVYFHGGGFVVGGLDSHDDVCAELCAITGFPLTAVDYRLCPEYPHPAAFHDALSGVEKAWRRQQSPILLCGDSAGANLAAAVAHQLRSAEHSNNPIKLAGQVLIYPGLGGDASTGSYQTHANAPLLTTEEVRFYTELRMRGSGGIVDATSAPLMDSCFADLPDTLIVTAQCDPLSDDGRMYRDAIVSAGGNAVWTNETGLVHGYLRARSTVSRARKSFERIADTLTAMGKGEWPGR